MALTRQCSKGVSAAEGAQVRDKSIESKGSARNPILDGIRGIAVLAVILYHLPNTFLNGGLTGVDIFFVLSGYLITGVFLTLISFRTNIFLGRTSPSYSSCPSSSNYRCYTCFLFYRLPCPVGLLEASGFFCLSYA